MSVYRPSSRLRARPKPKLKIGKSERTRAEILDAAFKFLWSRPFREMTVNALMASTRLSRPTFYQHFKDLYHLMESLLATLEREVLERGTAWMTGTGDPVALLDESLDGLVSVCYRRGPFLRAVADAATSDARLEESWNGFLDRFDHAVCERIRQDQELGLIEKFDPLPVAIAINRMDAYTFIQAFGRRPRRNPEPVRQAMKRLWMSALYGSEYVGKRGSKLVRKSTEPDAVPPSND